MDLLSLLGRMVLVFVLLAVVLLVLRRADSLRGRTAGPGLRVVSSTRLGKTATLTVVEVDGRRLVLGVTGQGVSVVTELPADQAVAQLAVPGVADATSLGALLAPAAAAQAPTPIAPPTVAAFLADAWRCVLRRPLASTDLSEEAVGAALAALDATSPAPQPADGPAAPRARAVRRTAARTDASPPEESPWSRARPAPRTSGKDAALV